MPIRDTWIRWIVPLPFMLFFLFFSQTKKTGIDLGSFVYPLAVLAISESIRYLVYQSHRWSRKKRLYLPRMMFLLLAGILCNTLILIAARGIKSLIQTGEIGLSRPVAATLSFNNVGLAYNTYSTAFVYGFIAFLFFLVVYEISYYFFKLRHTEKQRDKLANEKLQLELQQLKGIVNPHFLFNNLNSLSSLIADDPQQAEIFLDELTKVFRYLLRNNNTELISLREEMQFIRSYAHLLQTRYGRSLNLQVRLDEAALDGLLPPLTLQLLIENAVKHNKMSKDAPLQVELFNEGNNTLVLRNNLAVKEKSVESTGIGLQSINGRYGLLHHKGLQIAKTDSYFIVRIPLVTPETAPVVPALSNATVSAV
jgi:two-component system, LytTR family, sensor kinase